MATPTPRRILVTSHCVLNQNAVVQPLARSAGMMKSAVDWITEEGFGVVQLPCPEFRFLGPTRAPMTFDEYNTPEFHASNRELLGPIVAQLKLYQDNGYEIVGGLHVQGSPSVTPRPAIGSQTFSRRPRRRVSSSKICGSSPRRRAASLTRPTRRPTSETPSSAPTVQWLADASSTSEPLSLFDPPMTDLRASRIVVVEHRVVNRATLGGAGGSTSVLQWAHEQGLGVYSLPVVPFYFDPVPTQPTLEQRRANREALDFVASQLSVYLQNGYEVVGAVFLEETMDDPRVLAFIDDFLEAARDVDVTIPALWQVPTPEPERFDPEASVLVLPGRPRSGQRPVV